MTDSEKFAPGARLPETWIPLSVPEIRGNEWAYVKECLDTGWVSSVGPFVDRFERELAAYVGTKYAVATVNGTAALHIALLLVGVQPEDEVLVPALTFIAPANAIRYAGARPVFIDVEPEYWQMDPRKVALFLEEECRWRDGALYNRATGRRVRAILPVDVLGHPVNWDPIIELARRHDLAIVEDASESLGAKYRGRMVGQFGDIACFSFNGNKIMSTGGGGMIVTDNRAWANRAKYLTTQAKDDPVEYIHHEIGYNYRLTNVLAAMGCAQLEQMEEFVSVKRRIADSYRAKLAEVPGITPMQEAPWAFSTFWLYTVLVDESRYGMDSRGLLRRLAEQKVQARPLWQPLHRSKAHQGCQVFHGEVTESLCRDALSLPCSVGLGDQDMERVAGVVASSCKGGS